MGRGSQSGRSGGSGGKGAGAADRAMATLEKAALSMTPAGNRVYLHELRAKTGLSREAFDKAALGLQDAGLAVLYHNDGIWQESSKAAQEAGAIRLPGDSRPRHILLMDPRALKRRDKAK